MSLNEILNIQRNNFVSNIPWVYDFEIRAKLLRILWKIVQSQPSYDYDADRIEVQREFLFEDAIE